MRRWELEFNQFRLHHAYRTCGTSHYIPSCLTALLACYGPLYLSALGKPVVLEGYPLSTFYSYGAIETSADTAHDHVPLVALAFDRSSLDLACDLSMQLDLDGADLRQVQTIAVEFPSCPIRVGERAVAGSALKPVE